MERLTEAEQRTLLGHIEKMIDLTRSGMSPDDAFVKTAAAVNLSPLLATRVAETFNKGLSVHKLKKTASATRAEDFALIDIPSCIEKLYNGKTAAPHERVKFPDMSGLGKQASQRVPIPAIPFKYPSYNSEFVSGVKAQIKEAGLSEQIQNEAGVAYEKAAKAAKDFAVQATCLSKEAYRKVAQNICNIYGERGRILVNIGFGERREDGLESFEKTAEWSMLPAEPIYMAAEKAIASALDAAGWQQKNMLAKKASLAGIFGGIAAATTNKALQSSGVTGSLQSDIPDGTNPFRNRAFTQAERELNAKTNFYKLLLSDKELQGMDHTKVLEAYNRVLGLYPELAESAAPLSDVLPMVKRVINTDFKMDPSELALYSDMRSKDLKTDITDAERREMAGAAVADKTYETVPDMLIEPKTDALETIAQGAGNVVKGFTTDAASAVTEASKPWETKEKTVNDPNNLKHLTTAIKSDTEQVAALRDLLKGKARNKADLRQQIDIRTQRIKDLSERYNKEVAKEIGK